MSDLFALPLEVVIHILAFLEGRQIVRCISHAIENSITLQYLITLNMFGYTDGPLHADTACLNQLERHIDAWNNLDWQTSHVDAPLQKSGRIVLCKGILVTWDFNRVCCIQLPRPMRGILLRTWTLEDFAFPIHQIDIDPNSGFPMVRVMGPLLGVTLCFGNDLRLEIWDWMTGQLVTASLKSTRSPWKPQGLRLSTQDRFACRVRTLTDIVRLFASLGIHVGRTVLVTETSHTIASFSSPSFSFAEDNSLSYHPFQYQWISWVQARGRKPNFTFLYLLFVALLLHGDALAIPWEVWSKDVYFENNRGDYGISGGRVIRFTHSPEQLDSHCQVSLFDLNRFRAARLGRISGDPGTENGPLHAVKSDVLPREIRMECPLPIYLASRSFSLHGSPLRPYILCDDEHIVFWQCDVLCGPSWM
ncbi:hypothetical protein BS47DRAFT_1409101 [Hydnum rufescens UP504]|uniref:F-box domain-containing protein n=1 Tax=Hydnum rufescens UP504 TaxID=1448309 RepID=A0A9P6AT29_9AGAM|nr:hypothetical protein BS47DRAFT_1409101 [Hydnum rufescens UP504]